MSLADITIPTETVQTPGGDFVVRGLSLADFLVLVPKHINPLTVAFEHYVRTPDADTESDWTVLAQQLLADAPDLFADVIAHGAGEPDKAETVKGLGFSVQMEAIEKIGLLTFSAEGGPKKVLETVMSIVRGTGGLLIEVPKP